MRSPNRHFLSTLVLACGFASFTSLAQQAAALPAQPAAPIKIDCVEIDLFHVSQEKVEGQTDRADQIPERNLQIIRDDMLRFLPKLARGVTAVTAGQNSCPNPGSAAVLKGDILDFRRGSWALRYFVGFGAGSQKVRVRLTLSRKQDDAQLVQSEISDTKWGGVFGGSNTKGLADFAKKAAETVAKTLNQQ